jgi:DNA-binding response OmpR family regulator
MGFDVAQALLAKPNGKRKKRYVLHLLRTEHISVVDAKVTHKTIAAVLENFTLIKLEDPDEVLKVVMLKNIELIILDSSFFNSDETAIEFASEIKKRKKVPIYFTTKNERKLIAEYRRVLGLYEEMDDYLALPLDAVEMTKKITRIGKHEVRAAKRFGVEMELNLLRVDINKIIRVKIVDMSLVGFGLELSNDEFLDRGQQVRLEIPLTSFEIFHPQYGEVLKIAGTIRRVSIEGRRVGGSFEHMNPMQADCLSRLLEFVARIQRVKQLQQKGGLQGKQVAARAADRR